MNQHLLFKNNIFILGEWRGWLTLNYKYEMSLLTQTLKRWNVSEIISYISICLTFSSDLWLFIKVIQAKYNLIGLDPSPFPELWCYTHV